MESDDGTTKLSVSFFRKTDFIVTDRMLGTKLSVVGAYAGTSAKDEMNEPSLAVAIDEIDYT